MNKNHKLAYYEFVYNNNFTKKVRRMHFGMMGDREKIIFFEVLKEKLSKDERETLWDDLDIDPFALEDFKTKNEDFRYVLVGNIIDKHIYGPDKIIKRGTKHFRPGAKVILFPEFGGNGHIHIPVYGLPRKSRKKILVVIRSSMIKNVRVKKTFSPGLINKVDKSFYYDHFHNDKQLLQYTANAMNDTPSIEIIDANE